MDLPVIDPPVAPRWVWMEEITYSHIPIATLVTAYMILAPIFEYIGWKRKDPRFERLAKSFIWFAMILFSPGAALGTGIPMWIIGTYPEFWSRWANLFFWPLIAQFGFFLIEVGFLFFGYYLTWDAWQHRKKLHIFMGVMAAAFGICVQLVWDALGSYMMTPGKAALPGVTEPVGFSAAALLNPSFPWLFWHRVFGNFSYVMLLTGGVFALRYMSKRHKDAEEKAYFGWATSFCVAVGFLCFFAMPLIGLGYAYCLRTHAPVAFQAIMGGHAGYLFTLKMGLILTFLFLGGTYLATRYKSKALHVGITIGLLALLAVVLHHPPLTWFGNDVVWRVVAVAVLGGLIALLWLTRARRGNPGCTAWQWTLFAAGLAAFLTFCLGGFVRESSRQPHTVYGQLTKPEVTPEEADRFLTYQTCLRCHHADEGPKMFQRKSPRDWAKQVAVCRGRKGFGELTDDQARRIAEYLQESQP